MSKIFINIASFRDPLLVRTVTMAYEKADHPENLVFAIGLQYHQHELPKFPDVPGEQIKSIRYNIETRPGLTRIRYQISKSLYAGEEYFLMLDSHMSFVQGWDTFLIQSLLGLGDKAIISGVGQSRPDGSISFPMPKLQLAVRHEVAFRPDTTDLSADDVVGRDHILWPYISCGMMFTYGRFMEEVGQDEYVHFGSEEPYLSWRAFMSGWDIYNSTNSHITHTPGIYYDQVWGGRDKRTYLRDGLDTLFSSQNIRARSLAYVYNDYSYMAIKDSPRKPEDWFVACGYSTDEYKKILSAFDDILRNNVHANDIMDVWI